MGRLQTLDLKLLLFFRTVGHTSGRERIAARFAWFGEYGACWLVFALVGLVVDSASRGHWLEAVVAVATTYLLNTAVKLIVRRRRPQIEGLPQLASTPTQLSFPSAHAATSFAGAHAIARLLPELAPLLYLVAVAFALSRLYLGVHYPSDVVAGALLGLAVVEVAA